MTLIKTKLAALSNSLKDIEETYKKRLYNEVLPSNAITKDGKPLASNDIKWFNEKKAGKILSDEAIDFFITRANDEMQLDIKVEFSKNQIRTINFYADPVISDPRLRMSLEDKRWNEYDETIKNEVAYYNQKFAGVANFTPLDWCWVKAMLWTEVLAGPTERKGEWQQRPMQIGVGTDPSLKVVSNTEDDAPLIVSEDRRNAIRSNHFGHNNVIAGIAALYYKAIEGTKTEDRKTASRPILDSGVVETYIFKPGDTVESVAKAKYTISENIFDNTVYLTDSNGEIVLDANKSPVKLNKETTKRLRGGSVLKFQKAHYERYITDFRDWMTTIKNYNKNVDSTSSGGDSEYMNKVKRAYQIITSRTSQ